MKKLAIALLVTMTMLMMACTQYVYIPGDLIYGNDENTEIKKQNETDATIMLNYLQSEAFLGKVAKGSVGGMDVDLKPLSDTGTTALSSLALSAVNSSLRNGINEFLATVTFDKFSDSEANIYISTGSIQMTLYTAQWGDENDKYEINKADVLVTDKLAYVANGRSGTFEISYEEAPASGTITATTESGSGPVYKFDESTPITVTTPSDATIKVNDNNVAITENMGQQITNGFGGGSGTPEDPYLIYNAEQFSHIKDLVPSMATDPAGFYYFEVMDDIEFTADMDSPAIGIFRGSIDFNGHTLSGISNALINNNLSESQLKYMYYDTAYGLIENFLEGSISNLEYRPENLIYIAFVTHLPTSGLTLDVFSYDSTVTFTNVNAYGDFSEPNNNNTSCYIGIAYRGHTEFVNCKNYASQVTSYGGAFVGGYPSGRYTDDNNVSYDTYVTFTDCVNYGNITGTQVAVFIGSYNTISTMGTTPIPVIKVNNCENYGIIQGTQGVGYYFPVKTGKANPSEYSWFDMTSDANNTGNDAEHIILLAEAEDVTVTLNEQNQFTISNSNDEYSSFMIQGTTYANTYNEAGTHLGTLRIYVPADQLQCSSGNSVTTALRNLQMIDSANESIDETALSTLTEDEYGNSIITVNDTDYYYHDGTKDDSIVGGNSLVTNLKWTLTCYDNDGFVIAQKDIEIE